MTAINDFSTFILSCILLTIIPGADTMFIIGKSLSKGRKGGIYSALGMSSSLMVHTLLATFGISILISQSLVGFKILKIAGALYLIYLGVKMFFDKGPEMGAAVESNEDNANGKQMFRLFSQGLLINLLNPKVVLFFLAFLPQFITPVEGSTSLPFLALGASFCMIGSIWGLCLVFFSSGISQLFQKSEIFKKYFFKVSGSILALLGLKLIFDKD